MKDKIVVAIDGPAGSGKSTVAKLIARELNLAYLDTGAMYRTATLACLKEGLDFSDEEAIYQVIKNSSLEVNSTLDKFKIYLNGEDVSNEIRSPLINKYISKVSEIPEVRELLVQKQREIGKAGAVVEGRDIGTVVFPDAGFKIFLDANFDIRVERRYREMISKGIQISKEEVAQDLKIRDQRDKSRKYGPLKKAGDAFYIDSSNLSIEEVVQKILSYIGRS